jgi:hypothetical protein
MAHAYTPGLKVTDRTRVRKERRLPLPGETTKVAGDVVKGEDVVARTALPGNVSTVNVAGLLGVPPEDIKFMMHKKVGDAIEKDELLAQSKGLLGLFKSSVPSPVKGTVESISDITGQVILREAPQPVEVTAYIDGEVTEVIPREGVIVESIASFIQGIFGIGGEVRGELLTVAEGPNDLLKAEIIKPEHKGKVLIGGSLADEPLLRAAAGAGVHGIVVGGVEDATLKKFLGYDIGVAITGSEKCGVTLVVTEGFGRMRMADRTFGLLKTLNGKVASINGATQIRAGVIRPEVIVPCADKTASLRASLTEGGLKIGTPIRIIREPHFGALGKVSGLPSALQKIETESLVRVLEVELEDGSRVMMPRANVEIIES